MFDPTTFTGFHTWLSLIALVTGLVVLADLIEGRSRPIWTMAFLIVAASTSITGFGFPFTGLLPSHVVGSISLAVLVVAAAANYSFRLSGAWRLAYVVGVCVSVYLLAFVAVAQLFLKVAPLHRLAPTGAEIPFIVAQIVVLALFTLACFASARRFRPALAT